MMFWYGGHLVFWQASLMWIAMIAFWGLIAWAVYVLLARATLGPGHADHSPEAHRTLDQRLANGEINIEEYQSLREAIGHRERTSMGSGIKR